MHIEITYLLFILWNWPLSHCVYIYQMINRIVAVVNALWIVRVSSGGGVNSQHLNKGVNLDTDV